MALSVGDVVSLVIEKPVAGGRALARHGGQVVLVAGAIPGEHVAARIERTARGVTLATTVDVLDASADRRDAPDWRCGGNVYGFVAYPRQLELKREIVEDAFARIGRAPLTEPPSLLASPETGSRVRVRLHSNGRRLGFYREASHAWCDPVATGHLSPEAVGWVAGCSEGSAAGALGRVLSLELAETIDATARAAHVVLAPGTDLGVAHVLAAGLQGLSAQVGERGLAHLLQGSTLLSDRIQVGGAAGATLTLQRDVQAFFQGNRFLVSALVDEVMARVPAGPIVDLYAGVGLFGLALAARGAADVTLVEGDETSGRCLEVNAGPFASVRVVRRSVEAYWEAGAPPGITAGTVIVDPPRTGLSPQALAGLLQASPRHVVYVSCDPPTLARDARALTEHGYRREPLTILDMFPRTAHVEVVVRFSRT